MTPYEFLLSESQERMLFVVKPGCEEALMERFRRWGLQAAVVGRVLEENVVRVLQHGEVAAEVPASALAEDTPINHHTLLAEPPEAIQAHWRWRETDLPSAGPDGLALPQGKVGWGRCCCGSSMTPPLPASAGYGASTTIRCRPTPWCPGQGRRGCGAAAPPAGGRVPGGLQPGCGGGGGLP